jgi:hypothetical protein
MNHATFKKCDCYEYKKNAQAFAMLFKSGIVFMTMDLFKHCPYCGKLLQQMDVDRG